VCFAWFLPSFQQGTLTTLQALTSDREIVLPDGRKLLGHDKFEELSKQTGLSFAQLRQRNVFPIHPSFRLVAVGKPAASAEGQTKLSYHWLTPELNTMFLFVWVRNLDQVEESQVYCFTTTTALQRTVSSPTLHLCCYVVDTAPFPRAYRVPICYAMLV
jgi:hypothetical protein